MCVCVGKQDTGMEELREEGQRGGLVYRRRRKEKKASRALPFYFQGCAGDDGEIDRRVRSGFRDFFRRVRGLDVRCACVDVDVECNVCMIIGKELFYFFGFGLGAF